MDVKQRILELMEKRGWSKYRLSKETGIYITTINDWFNEKQYTPSRDSIVSICEAMGITLAGNRRTQFIRGSITATVDV